METMKELSVQQLIDTIKNYYAKEPSGGNLHIVLDDGNTETCFVLYCYKQCIINNDYIGELIAYNLILHRKSIVDQIYSEYDYYSGV